MAGEERNRFGKSGSRGVCSQVGESTFSGPTPAERKQNGKEL